MPATCPSRSSAGPRRSFLALWVELLAEAYAAFAEDVALDALANAMGGWGEGDALNPARLNLGAAFVNSFDAMKPAPGHHLAVHAGGR